MADSYKTQENNLFNEINYDTLQKLLDQKEFELAKAYIRKHYHKINESIRLRDLGLEYGSHVAHEWNRKAFTKANDSIINKQTITTFTSFFVILFLVFILKEYLSETFALQLTFVLVASLILFIAIKYLLQNLYNETERLTVSKEYISFPHYNLRFSWYNILTMLIQRNTRYKDRYPHYNIHIFTKSRAKPYKFEFRDTKNDMNDLGYYLEKYNLDLLE